MTGRDAGRKLDTALGRVLEAGACTGCGMCTLLDPGLAMELDADGYARPVRRAAGTTPANAAQVFRRACPGSRVQAGRQDEATSRHETLGQYLGVWEAWATDPAIRHRGSSGGALTAIHTWLMETGRAVRITGAGASPGDPRRTVPVTILTREEALAAAGSRYAPVGALANPDVAAMGTAVVGKPCEAAALRALEREGWNDGGEPPLLLSFFCAGTPSAHATDELVERLGFPREIVPDELWSRGRGWPGRFTVRAGKRSSDTSYDESWGKVLGPSTQWRCKVCADGVGESADIVAADYWRADAKGYPVFDEGHGSSALIARSTRGLETVLAAAAAGAVQITPIGIESLAAVQPLQDGRRRLLLGRLLGSLAAGRRPPRFIGFGLFALAASRPRELVRVARGTYRRVRAGRGARK